MLTLNDGRSELWQWDTGSTLAVDADCSQVHFSNKVFGRSIDVDVIDGIAIIPDILLQTDKDLNVWAFVGTAENGYTKISKTFKVNRRNKPADYVFTPQEQITLKDATAILEEAKDVANGAMETAKKAEASADNAAKIADEMKKLADQVEKNTETATKAKADALTAQTKAEEARNAAETAKTSAETAKVKAETAQSKAEAAAASAERNAEQAATDAKTATDAKVAADGSADAAAGSAVSAVNSASAAARSERAAGASEAKAAESEKSAKESEHAAAQSAATADKRATDAENAAKAAATATANSFFGVEFTGSIGEDGKLHSVAGAIPSMGKTIQQNLDAARLWGDKYSIGTSADAELLLYLMVVAYGTRNVQAKVMGVVSLYQNGIAVTAETTDEAAVVCAKGALEVGNIISVGTGGEDGSVARYRMVTAVEAIAGDTANVKCSVSGAAFTATTAHKIWRIINGTGTANSVIASCGSPVSNTDGRHSFVFYGVENPLYGNQWRFEADYKLIDGVPYICNDTNYQWSSLDGYTKLDVEFPAADGYIKNLAADERYPQLPLPKEIGASSTTYCADYFYINREGTRIALRGGYSGNGRDAGPFDISLDSAAGLAWWLVGADLSVPG